VQQHQGQALSREQHQLELLRLQESLRLALPRLESLPVQHPEQEQLSPARLLAHLLE
jgi:hypothetical protein